jgi:hypothetical protein
MRRAVIGVARSWRVRGLSAGSSDSGVASGSPLSGSGGLGLPSSMIRPVIASPAGASVPPPRLPPALPVAAALLA